MELVKTKVRGKFKLFYYNPEDLEDVGEFISKSMYILYIYVICIFHVSLSNNKYINNLEIAYCQKSRNDLLIKC